MLYLRKSHAFELAKGYLFLIIRHREIERAIKADVKEGLKLHLGQTTQDDLLLDMLPLKDVMEFIYLNMLVFDK